MTKIKLTDSQVEDIRLAFSLNENIKNHLADIVIAALTEQAKAELVAWDQCAKLAGFDNISQLKAQGYKLRIEWITSELVLLEEESG